jgi:hypothetical protein
LILRLGQYDQELHRLSDPPFLFRHAATKARLR